MGAAAAFGYSPAGGGRGLPPFGAFDEPFVPLPRSQGIAASTTRLLPLWLTGPMAFWLAAAAAVLFRLAVWVGTIFRPLSNEVGAPVSPLHANSQIDLAFYQATRIFYGGWIEIFAAAPLADWPRLIGVVSNHLSPENYFGPPFMAAMLSLFDYGPHNTLPLAVFFLLLSCAVAVLWLLWLHRHGLGLLGLLFVALMPGPLWFMLNVSTDLPFAALLVAFFLVFFSDLPRRTRYLWALAIAVAATLLRPHGVSMFLFLGLYEAFLAPGRTRRQQVVLAAVLGVAGVAMMTVFSGYFLWYVQTSSQLDYFGYTAADFLAGIFPGLPAFLDQPLSWLSLLGAKFLYLVGLRPSYGDAASPLVLVRAAAGLVLLPGLLYGFFRAPWAYRFLLAAFFAPVLFGSAQDRYVMPVAPLLVLFAERFLYEVGGFLTGRRPVFPRLPLERA